MDANAVVVMTTVHAKPEVRAQVIQALQAVAAAARAEVGCIEYRVFGSADDADTTVNYERWSSNEAREKFLNGPAVAAFAATVNGAFSESPQPVSYNEIG
jgi:quinol monooxygenase YgiN